MDQTCAGGLGEGTGVKGMRAMKAIMTDPQSGVHFTLALPKWK